MQLCTSCVAARELADVCIKAELGAASGPSTGSACRWREGRCSFGDKCTYAHGEQELRALPPEGYLLPPVCLACRLWLRSQRTEKAVALATPRCK